MTRQEMREAIRPLMSEERYRHSLGVEKEAERLARRWGEDPEKAAIAGILHDCCKEMPLPEALQIMRRFPGAAAAHSRLRGSGNSGALRCP